MASSTPGSDPAALNAEQLRVVDQARQRLDMLTKSIEAVRHAVVMGRPMPDLPALQAHSAILTQTTSSLTSHLSQHADLLATLVAYPSTNFPGRTQEGLAGHLLRKKLEPNVEMWVDEGRGVGQGREDKGEGDGGDKGGRMEEEWRFAAGWTLREAQRVIEESRARGDELEGSEEDGSDGEGEGDTDTDMEIDGSRGVAVATDAGGKPDGGGIQRSIPQMARFMNTGIMP